MEWTQPPKPRYDPWEVFKPTKTFLKEVIKGLKQQTYEIIKQRRESYNETDQYPDNGIFVDMCTEPQLQKLNRRIKDYQYRINDGGRNPGNIGHSEILRAKESDIREFFVGPLRKVGKNSIGLCPFHNDKHPSFTIYDQGRRFKCFSCGASGDAPDYIMKTMNLKFPSAIKYILNLK